MSALLTKADIRCRDQHVRFVPKADISGSRRSAAHLFCHPWVVSLKERYHSSHVSQLFDNRECAPTFAVGPQKK